MSRPPKEVFCDCGHSFTIDKKRNWCFKCGEPVFYNPADKKKHKRFTYYIYIITVLVILFLTYLFIELIASPLLD